MRRRRKGRKGLRNGTARKILHGWRMMPWEILKRRTRRM
jgi:hypothetical protein